jgi:hypothetical protein
VGAEMTPGAAVKKALETLLLSDAKKATVYVSEDMVVSVCRRFKPDGQARSVDFVLKMGKPNYMERAFLAACKQAAEPIPLHKAQLRQWPVRRA